MHGGSWLTQLRRHVCPSSLVALCRYVTQLCHSEGLPRCVTADAWQIVSATTKTVFVASHDSDVVASSATTVAFPFTEGTLRSITADAWRIVFATTGQPAVASGDDAAVAPDATTAARPFTEGHLRCITADARRSWLLQRKGSLWHLRMVSL